MRRRNDRALLGRRCVARCADPAMTMRPHPTTIVICNGRRADSLGVCGSDAGATTALGDANSRHPSYSPTTRHPPALFLLRTFCNRTVAQSSEGSQVSSCESNGERREKGRTRVSDRVLLDNSWPAISGWKNWGTRPWRQMRAD